MELTEKAFEEIFINYYKPLHAYAFTLLRDADLAEEQVQEVFFKTWQNRKGMHIHSSLKAWLYKSVYHQCIDQLRRNKKVFSPVMVHNAGAAEKIESAELQKMIQDVLNELPQQCRTIFQLSRFEDLKYRDIATALNLSVKTVEAQMSKALKRLRKSLGDFLPILIFILWT